MIIAFIDNERGSEMQNQRTAPAATITEATAIDLMFTGFRKSFIHDNRRVIVSCYGKPVSGGYETLSFICEVERTQTSPDLYSVYLYDELGRVVAMCKCDDADK